MCDLYNALWSTPIISKNIQKKQLEEHRQYDRRVNTLFELVNHKGEEEMTKIYLKILLHFIYIKK